VRRLILLDSALEDFSAILDHIARESGSRAIGRGFADELWRQCVKLSALPGTLGRARPELRYRDDAFEVVNVIEGHRDIIAYFDDDR
jgi:toxin ParE1/3/4